jgi:hypothetical protein
MNLSSSGGYSALPIPPFMIMIMIILNLLRRIHLAALP